MLIETSGTEFHDITGSYIHHSQQVFDTGLQINLLQRYIFISLDVFREVTYTIDKEIEAWLLFLSSDKPADIVHIIEAYPFFANSTRR